MGMPIIKNTSILDEREYPIVDREAYSEPSMVSENKTPRLFIGIYGASQKYNTSNV